jgi:hypothetical protein
MIVAPSRRRCVEVKPCRSQRAPRRARSRSRSTSWTSASRCLAPSYSWIRRVPSIRKSARAMKDRVCDGGRHPPAPEPSGRQVRESRGSGQDQLPRRQFFELRTAQRGGVYPASDAFPFSAPEPSAGGRACSALYSHAGSMRTRSAIVRASCASGDRPWCRLSPVDTGHLPHRCLGQTGHPQPAT